MSHNKGPNRPPRPDDEPRVIFQALRAIHDDVHGLRGEICAISKKLDAFEPTQTAIISRLELLTRIITMFEDLETKVDKITNASDAMQVVLTDVKGKLDAIIAGGGIPAPALAKLQALSTRLDVEADDIISHTLANTPAAEEPPTP